MDSPCTLLSLAAVALSLSAAAQAVPRIDSSATSWFQRGTTNEFTVAGEAFGSVTTVLITGSGLSGSLVAPPQTNLTLEASGSGLTVTPLESTKSLAIRLTVSDESPLGAHELRLAGPNGVSNPLTLNVSDLPELKEIAPNQTPTDAPRFTLPAAVSGVISASAEADHFRFKGHAGETLLFDVQANRFGSPLDPTLVILDAAGKEVARSEDVHGLDPFLEFTPSADGEYTVKLHDLRFQGGGDYRYRVVAGALPYLEFLFPFGGRRGSTVEVQLQGRGLEGTEKLNVRIAPDAAIGRQELRAHTAKGHSNPQPFEAGDLPEFLEAEPNNATNQANGVTVPIVINGRIGEPKDEDFFRFKSPADQKWVVEVQARRFGSPLDAILTLWDAQGQVLQRNDDANGPDARLEFDGKKDTEYGISLRDLTDRGGSRFGYRLTIQPPNTSPDFSVRVPAGRFRITRGGSTAIRCELDRRNGFDGVVRVMGDRLPAGVTATALVLGSSPNFGWLVLTATDEAPLGFFPLQLKATGELAGNAVSRPVQLAEQGWLTVLPPAPVSVEVAQASARLEQNSNVGLEVSITRREGFRGEVKIAAEELPGVSVGAVTLPPEQARAKLNVNAAYNAETGTRPLLIRAETIAQGITNLVSVPGPLPLTVEGIPLFLTAMLPGSPFFRTDPVRLSAVALPTNSASAANLTEFVVKVDRRGLTNEIALALEGLPAGVVATVNPIKADKNEATIRLLVSDQAEAGKEHTFYALGTVTYNDRIWRQKTQPVTLTIASPEKETAATTSPAAAK